MLRRRMVWRCLAAMAAALATAACGLGGGGSDPVQVTILVGFSTGMEYPQIELHQQLQREFNAGHRDINIRFVNVNYAEHEEKFGEMLADGKAPDLVLPIGVEGIAGFHDAWLDLAPYLGKTEGLEQDLPPRVLAAAQEGKQVFGLPLGYYPAVLYYNADMFDRAKVSYPPHRFGETGWNYDQVLKIAAKMTRDRNGKYPADKGFDPANIVQYGYDGGDWAPLRALCAKFAPADAAFSPDLRSATLDNPGWRRALRFLRDSIYEAHVRPKTSQGGTIAVYGDNDPLGSNRTAMWETFSWIQYSYSAWNANFNWDVAAVPADGTNPPVVPFNVEALAIPRAAPNPRQSWEVAKWLLKPENLKRLSLSYGCIPARRSLSAAWLEDMRKINQQVDWQVFLDAGDYLAAPNHDAWVPNYRKVQDALRSLMDGVGSGAYENVDQALASTKRQVQGYFDEYWKLSGSGSH